MGLVSRRIGLIVVLLCVAVVGVMAVAPDAGASTPAWSVVASPNQGGSDNQLQAVACTSASTCIAVGQYENGSDQNSLVESWDGTTWSIVASPNAGLADILTGVSCLTASNCTAVGWYFDESTGTTLTLVESWDGTTWSIVPSPNVGFGDDNVLTNVSCASASSCVAVGYIYDGFDQVLIESWDGSSWSVMTNPPLAGENNELVSVSCPSPTSCQAVGFDGSDDLIASWDGSVWTNVASPNSANSGLGSVSCLTTTSCVAVGDVLSGSPSQTLVETWDGTVWAVVPSPSPGSVGNGLSSVSCTGPTSCAAVGEQEKHPSKNQTLVETWDGTSWSAASSPSPSPTTNILNGVSCASTTGCVAVGTYLNGSIDQTLTAAPASPIVSQMSPSTGFTTGGTVVQISGSGFTGTSGVTFGGAPATSVTVNNDGSITATSPPGSAGTADVIVTASGGSSSVTPADAFTYTVDASPTTVSCSANTPCTDNVTTPLNDTSVSVSGDPGASTTASESLVVNTDTLSCGGAFDYPTAVATLSSSGFSAPTVTVTETIGNDPSVAGLKTCFQAAGSTTNSFLKPCKSGAKFRAPCQQSLVESAGSAVATLVVPSNDPRFWVGGAPVSLKSFSPTKAKPGATVTVKGKNMTQVTAAVIGGAVATIDSVSATKVVVTVPENADSGTITLTAASGSATSRLPFTVT